MCDQKNRIGIIGLGYVGLPLAVAFAQKYSVIGFDLKQKRVNQLNQRIDETLETTSEALAAAFDSGLVCTTDLNELKTCTIYIVTVPTPVDQHKQPDLTPIIKGSESVASVLSHGNIVIYESTVYPGCTEEICVPILEKGSGLTFNQDFFCGYSPERINPGDKIHTLETILKITSGSTPDVAHQIDQLYRSIIPAGTHLAPSIKVAEAAKVIENAQRDINIAFINELSIIFDRLGIDTHDVLTAASTKWNFLPFTPGLVGGHCIGVDPYYLTYKAESVGYHPQVILSGRRINDQMGIFVANKFVKLMIQKGIQIKGSQVLMLGITFKENCPDIRNTKAVDLYRELVDFGCEITLYDPWADPEEVASTYGIYGITSVKDLKKSSYDGIILAVAHQDFNNIDLKQFQKSKSVLYDVKGNLDQDLVDGRL